MKNLDNKQILEEKYRSLLDELDKIKIDLLEERMNTEQARWDEIKRFAEFLHNRFCPYNHCDQCSWGYESGSSSQSMPNSAWLGKYSSHQSWLERAERILAIIKRNDKYKKHTVDQIIELVDLAMVLVKDNDEAFCVYDIVRKVN